MEKESKYVEFSTANNKYIYDAVSGEVIPSGKWIGYIIDNFYLLSKEELIEKCHVSYRGVNTVYRYRRASGKLLVKETEELRKTMDEILSEIIKEWDGYEQVFQNG